MPYALLRKAPRSAGQEETRSQLAPRPFSPDAEDRRRMSGGSPLHKFPAIPTFSAAPAHTVQRTISDLPKGGTESLAKDIKAKITNMDVGKAAIKKALDDIHKDKKVTVSAEEATQQIAGSLGLQWKEQKAKTDVAGEAKQKKIAPYLALVDHLGGETDGKTVTGGHLLTHMRTKWADRLNVVGQENNSAAWECQWRLDNMPLKASTMFPSVWTIDTLRDELMGATEVSGKITLKSGIPIRKAGDTFYPEA